MLDRRHRLTSSAGFRRATRRGRRAGAPTVVLHLGSRVADGATDGARIGFAVSKAVGNAVVRNRVKRRLRHLVRIRLALLPDTALLVVRALPEAAHASSAELDRDLDTALRRLGIAGGAVPRVPAGPAAGPEEVR